MRALSWAVLAVLALAGCQRDPFGYRFVAGQEAMTCRHDDAGNALHYSSQSGIPCYVETGGEFPHALHLKEGTKVRIIDDSDSDSTLADSSRDVSVRVLEGEHADKVGKVRRTNLRPIP